MMKQVGLRLEEEMIKQVKIKAVEENTSFQSIVEQALEQYLNPQEVRTYSKEYSKTLNILYQQHQQTSKLFKRLNIEVEEK